jgi:predicted alpha/beta hydrolase
LFSRAQKSSCHRDAAEESTMRTREDASPGPEITTLSAIDGERLVARLYRASSPHGAVVIAPAMGVPQTFYARFATWLASRGYETLTFDYRGSGESRRGSMRDVDVDVIGWARLDANAALRAMRERHPQRPITWIGHSLGGQVVPFVPDHRELAKIVTVAAGSGYWRQNVPQLRRFVWLLWYLAVPVSVPLVGYFPGRALRMVGDLPRGVIEQWRAWCLHPGYAAGAEIGGHELFLRVTTPITSLSFTDDEMMSADSIASLHRAYAAARVKMRRIAPRDVGVVRIGHFGFFKAPAIWDQLVAPELARMPSRETSERASAPDA